MHLTVLGSGTLIPDDRRRSAAHLVETGDVRLLMDCGAGTVHGFDRHGVAWRQLTHLAFSHYHIDHTGDVTALMMAFKWGMRPPREAPLTVLGPPGLRSFLDRVGEAFGETVSEPGFPLELVEIGRRGSWEDPSGGLRLVAHPTRHTDASVAWRVASAGASLGYTGDTGPEPGLGAFFSGVDVLISECSFPDPPPMDTHLTPRGVAEIARRAGPRLLLLTHLYPFLEPGRAAGLVREAGFSGRVRVAWDGTRVEVEGGEVRVTDPGDSAVDEGGPGVDDGET